ncbi:MAG: CPXCG motif-containing cysteine-rich protein [Gammaproteobacteria bacterium]|nr:CPXCG motif-containing cysteine-rich protein [Gammaproteobacteria bacterium]
MDTSGGSQEYVEDCQVCCRPILFEARHPWRAPCGRAKARPILFQTKLSGRG